MTSDLLVCGSFENAPLALKINNSDTTLVSDVKSQVSKAINISEKELILYFSDSILPNDTPLSQWKDMRSGAAVLVTAKPLIVTLQRYNSDIDVKFELPRLAVPNWSTQSLFKLCRYKGGLPNRNDGKYIYIVDGLKIQSNTLSQYSCFSDNFTITVSFLQKIPYKNVVSKSRSHCDYLYAPLTVSSGCIEKAFSYEHKREHQIEQVDEAIQQEGLKNYATIRRLHRQFQQEFSEWKLIVQRMDGTKVIVEAKNHFLTSVCELRQQISPNTNIRLVFGTTILEDWDDDGNMMLLCSYPDLHDGATLCQINLTGAMKIKVSKPRFDIKLHDQLHLKLEEHIEVNPEIIFIENPHHCTITRFIHILKNFTKKNVYQKDKSGKHIDLQPSDDPVSSLIAQYKSFTSYNTSFTIY